MAWCSGALLALISSGLTIIYGTLGVLNLAHGALFMLGGYAGFVAYQFTGSFIVAVAAGSLFVLVVGVVIERGDHPLFLRPAAGGPDSGDLRARHRHRRDSFAFLSAASRNVCRAPSWATGITSLGFMFYPTYRLAVVGIIAVALLALYLVLYRTRLGMIVRAGIEDAGMVDALGINVYRIFMMVFGIGAMAAGFAGIVQRAGSLAHARYGRIDSGRGLRRGRHRRRRFLSRRRSRRPDRRRDHEHHLDDQPGLFQVMLFAVMTLVLVVSPYGLLGAARPRMSASQQRTRPSASLPDR